MAAPATLEDQWVQSVVSRFQGPLTVYAARLVGSERAKDVVQDTFLKLCKQDREDLQGREGAWLYTVCRNRALDLIRQEGRVVPLEVKHQEKHTSRAPQPAEMAELRQEATEALDLIQTLPERQQLLLRLKFSRGLSYREIAEETGLSVSNVGYILHVSIKALRAKMKARGYETEGGSHER